MIDIEPNEFEIMVELAKHISVCPSKDPDEFCKQAKELSCMIPERIKAVLKEFVIRGSPTGFLLFGGILENDDFIVMTPPDNTRKIGETTTLAKIQAILISFMGEMIAYEAEGYGELFQDVVPVESMAKNQTSVGSNTELEIHTEQAFSKLRPDFLSLACLRGDPNAFTYILPVGTILDNLSIDEIELLNKPHWYTGVDLSFKLNGHEFIEGDIRGPMSILGIDKSDIENPAFSLRFDQDLMYGTNDESQQMIKKVVDIYYRCRISHNLKPGEIIFLDNRFAVHGRSPFFPKYDGNDRFLVRCFATLDYDSSAHARMGGGRTVSAIYS